MRWVAERSRHDQHDQHSQAQAQRGRGHGLARRCRVQTGRHGGADKTAVECAAAKSSDVGSLGCSRGLRTTKSSPAVAEAAFAGACGKDHRKVVARGVILKFSICRMVNWRPQQFLPIALWDASRRRYGADGDGDKMVVASVAHGMVWHALTDRPCLSRKCCRSTLQSLTH